MKTTLILLIAVVIGGCGVSMHEVKVEIAQHELRELNNDAETRGRMIDWIASVEKKADAKTLVKLWDEYAKECYNDSTEVSQDIVWVNGRATAGKKNYSHNTRPTFNGFIEYLRAKQ